MVVTPYTAHQSVGEFMVVIAEILSIKSDGEFNWDPESSFEKGPSVYPPTGVGIYLKAVPIVPDRVLVISPYLDDSELVLPLRTIDFQIRSRGGGDPIDCDQLGEKCINILHGLHRVVWNGYKIELIQYRSYFGLGPDVNGRWESTNNFRMYTQRKA